MLLDAYRVLDLTDHRGQFCGKILADLGADVIKVEPPEGDPARKTGPFIDDDPDPGKSLYWAAHNTSKRSITLDLQKEKDRNHFLRLAGGAKFLLESFTPGYLDKLGLSFEFLNRLNPSLILVSITPFGQTGPYARFKDSDLINMGLGGQMALCGDRDRAPLRFTAEQSYPLGGIYGALAALAAHLYREKTGLGQHIDVSIQESVFQTARSTRTYWDMQKFLEQREGPRMGRGVINFRNLWSCKNGVVCWRIFVANLGKWTAALFGWMNEEGLAADLSPVPWEDLDMATLSQKDIDRFEVPIQAFFLKHTKEELFRESLKRGFVLFPLSTVRDLYENEQLKARAFWQEVSYPSLDRTIPHPGPPFIIQGMNYSLKKPPAIGEHTQEILGQETGGSGELSEQPQGPQLSSLPDRDRGPALEGLKVLDFSWVIAGPKGTKYLANLGATVVRVESEQRLDFLRAYPPFPEGISGINRSGTFAHLNDGKYGMALNTKHPKARGVLEKLVQWADVVVENFTPGTMERWGLAYEDLRKINPEIIMLRGSLMGQTGPYAHQTGLGTMLQAYAGFSNLVGWPDRVPVGSAAPYSDFPTGGYIAVGVLAGLDYKRRTGRGFCIDLSQLEVSQQMLIPALLDYGANRRVLQALGNRHPHSCPHGAYPCRGEDRWCLISVFNEKEWGALKSVMGNPLWSEEEKFSSLEKRKSNEDEVDRLISAWSIHHSAEGLMDILQEAGVPAGMVKNGQDIHEDPQLAHRGHLVRLKHQEMGMVNYDCPPFRLSLTPLRMEMPSPCLGEHTEMVCREFLKMGDEEFFELLSEGVFE
ncbi:MAG: CoA transferase [Deltaproteobacteria bacterium]|nr:CoA transferase [Deltaproteobacteria bacterium]